MKDTQGNHTLCFVWGQRHEDFTNETLMLSQREGYIEHRSLCVSCLTALSVQASRECYNKSMSRQVCNPLNLLFQQKNDHLGDLCLYSCHRYKPGSGKLLP